MRVDLLQFNILIKISDALLESCLKGRYLIAQSAFLSFTRYWILQLHLEIFYTLWGLITVVRELLDFSTTFLTTFDLILFLLNLLQLWLILIRVLHFLSIANWQDRLVRDATDWFDMGFWLVVAYRFTPLQFAINIICITAWVLVHILHI